MSLKKSIVIKNEFSIKTRKGGSRGGSPGSYVIRYMAREGATEDIAPVKRKDTDQFITHYMARSSAVDKAVNVLGIKYNFEKADGLGGVAFSHDDISLSDAKIRSMSRDIQEKFDSGKTVLKTVLSFDTEYLKQNGILPSDFNFEDYDSFYGNVDQLRLRRGIMNGISKMASEYDDLRAVGVIQVDTKHVHAHLVLCDYGDGNLMKDGTQKGKISEKAKSKIRRGIDLELDKTKQVQYLSSNVMYNKRNLKCFVKKFTHDMMARHGFGQFLLSCLPENENYWRADSNRLEMRKANNLVSEYVKGLFDKDKVAYNDALKSIYDYASERKKREALSNKDERKLIDNGKKKLLHDCMNAVYSVVKNIPKEKRKVKTPMLDVMSKSYEALNYDRGLDPILEFGFKLRSYSSRLNYHKKEYKKYDDLKKIAKNIDTSSDGKVVVDFYEVEADYHEKCMNKYQHFLGFLPASAEYEEEFNQIMEYGYKKDKLADMIGDKTFSRFKSDKAAEDYGLDVYNQKGGMLVKRNRDLLLDRLDKMSDRYYEMIGEFNKKLKEHGMKFDGNGVKRSISHDFDDVKALDLHHLSYDWTFDIDVSKPNIDAFISETDKRYDAYIKMKEYLDATDQSEYLKGVNGSDIELMKEFSDYFRQNDVLKSKKSESSDYKRLKTVTLDENLNEDFNLSVKSILKSHILE